MKDQQMLSKSWKNVSQVLCILIFLAMMMTKCYELYANHGDTTTTTRLVNLAEIPFPLDLEISVNPGFNQTALWELGYASSTMYFWGASRFNNTVYGWGGHTQDGEAIGDPKGNNNTI